MTLTTASSYPRQRGDVRTVADTTGMSLVDVFGSTHVLNDTAMALWQVCDGRTSEQEIIDGVCMLFQADATTVREDVRRTLAALRAARLIEWSGHEDHGDE